MTSPSLLSQPVSRAPRREQSGLYRIGLPILLFAVTMLTTTAVGMRYMHNFRLGNPPLGTDEDILPYVWVFHHLSELSTGLPFSLTLVGILLAHEFGHYFACRRFGIRSTLPYLLPAPSLSGTFGAVIRLQSVIRTRAALIAVGASGPIAGFVVAVAAVLLGLSLSTYAMSPIITGVQPPLTIVLLHRLMQEFAGAGPLKLIVPHPVLIASWVGLLITALNLIPAGQLDGGHILYAVSPTAHRWASRAVVAGLFLLGIFSWLGWFLWAVILLIPAMRHPRVPDTLPLGRSIAMLAPVCLVLFLLTGMFAPFEGYSLLHMASKLLRR